MTQARARSGGRWRLGPGLFMARPKLMIAFGPGLAAGIGLAAQTADVAFTGKGLRRLGAVHSLIALVFNTLILALTINLLAGLV